MKKTEFLEELEVSLQGKLSAEDICQILADYADIFTGGMAEGKSEDQISHEIGSPARIAKTILEDDNLHTEERASYMRSASQTPANLASMGTRLGAYLLDSLIFGGLLALLGLLLFTVDTASVHSGYPVSHNIPGAIMQIIPLITLLLIAGGGFLMSTLFVYFTNGYTPGKWLLKIRIVKLNGTRITFWEALLRETVMKTIANAICSGFLNLGSFIWGCCSPEHKTVHDLVAQTTVINVLQYRGK